MRLARAPAPSAVPVATAAGRGEPGGTVRAPYQPAPAPLAVTTGRLHPWNGRLSTPVRGIWTDTWADALSRRSRGERGGAAGPKPDSTRRGTTLRVVLLSPSIRPRLFPCHDPIPRNVSGFSFTWSATAAHAAGIRGRPRRRGSRAHFLPLSRLALRRRAWPTRHRCLRRQLLSWWARGCHTSWGVVATAALTTGSPRSRSPRAARHPVPIRSAPEQSPVAWCKREQLDPWTGRSCLDRPHPARFPRN
jgi:hypothetical protein